MPTALPAQQRLVGYDGPAATGKDFALIELMASIPTPADDEVLVHVTHSALNPRTLL